MEKGSFARRSSVFTGELANDVQFTWRMMEDEKIKLASTIIQRAAENGLAEVQVYRFPNSLCTDQGRAIKQQEVAWENTLTGVAREIYQLWATYLHPRGYRIRYQCADLSAGISGDISIVLSWED